MYRQNRSFENIDKWFKQIREKYANHMQCGKGCTACCQALSVIVEYDNFWEKLLTPLS